MGTWIRIAVAAGLAAVALTACAQFERDEEEQPGPQPGIEEGQHDLDSDLCWQELGVDSDDDVVKSGVYDDAHAACMRKKGWTDEQ